MEHEAFGIDSDDSDDSLIDAALKAIAQMKRTGIRPA
jgi:hypothetical protein